LQEPPVTEPAMIRPTPATAAQAPTDAAEPEPPSAQAKRRKLDLTRIAPPENLETVRVEELSIDGICGVY
jgi:mycofactocin precursor